MTFEQLYAMHVSSELFNPTVVHITVVTYGYTGLAGLHFEHRELRELPLVSFIF